MATYTQQKFGEGLVAAGLITPEKLAQGMAAQRAEGCDLADVLVLRGFLSETALLKYFAEQLGNRYVTTDRLFKTRLKADVLDKIPARECERLCVLPLTFEADIERLTVAVPEPEAALLAEVRRVSGVASLLPVLALRMVIRAAIQRYYHNDGYAFASLSAGPAVATVTQTLKADFSLAPTLVRRRQQPESAYPATARRERTLIFGVHPDGPRLTDLGKATAEPDPQTPVQAPLDAPATPEAEPGARGAVHLLRLAAELDDQLRRETSLTGLLHRALACAFDRLPADDGAVLFSDTADGEMTPRAVRTRAGTESEVFVSEALIREVKSTRQAVLAADAVADPGSSGAAPTARPPVRSAMGAPLMVQGEVRGVVTVTKHDPAHPFTPLDLDAFAVVATKTGTAISGMLANRQRQASAVDRARFARFLPPSLVELAASGALSVDEEGALVEATVLWAEIRNFVALAERMAPRDVVAVLNEHFEAMVDFAFESGGTVDRVSDGALVALWGAPARRDDDAARALRAALEMKGRVRATNEWRQVHGGPNFEFAVGVATGMVVFGAVGAGARMDLTAIGEPVVMAARLCDLAPAGGVLASATTLLAAGTRFETKTVPGLKVKGKSKAVEAFAVLRERNKAR